LSYKKYKKRDKVNEKAIKISFEFFVKMLEGTHFGTKSPLGSSI
jgi:hypothetical protein